MSHYLTTPDELGKLLRSGAEAKIERILKTLPRPIEFAAAAYAGRAKRGWYQRSANALIEEVGKKDAPRFAALIAALSPQTSVESNMAVASKAWRLWEAQGSPTDREAILAILVASVPGDKGIGSVLPAWINNSVTALTAARPILSGPKVQSFAANLSGDADEVTNDAWMANFAGIPQAMLSGSGPAPGKSVGYIALSIRVREAARLLAKKTGVDWSPAEVQECVWSFAKTLYERRDNVEARQGLTAREIVAGGHLTHADIASTVDFATLLGNNSVALSFLAEPVNDPAGWFQRPGCFARHLDRIAARLDKLQAKRRGAL